MFSLNGAVGYKYIPNYQDMRGGYDKLCFFAGINPVIKGYTFLGDIPKPKGCDDITFERFDIDAMPGRNQIKLK